MARQTGGHSTNNLAFSRAIFPVPVVGIVEMVW